MTLMRKHKVDMNLTVDYDAGNKVDDQWLFMPKMKKMTRISSSRKSGSFMGSDLSFSDMTQQAVDQYSYKLLKANAIVRGEAAWVIEAGWATRLSTPPNDSASEKHRRPARNASTAPGRSRSSKLTIAPNPRCWRQATTCSGWWAKPG